MSEIKVNGEVLKVRAGDLVHVDSGSRFYIYGLYTDKDAEGEKYPAIMGAWHKPNYAPFSGEADQAFKTGFDVRDVTKVDDTTAKTSGLK